MWIAQRRLLSSSTPFLWLPGQSALNELEGAQLAPYSFNPRRRRFLSTQAEETGAAAGGEGEALGGDRAYYETRRTQLEDQGFWRDGYPSFGEVSSGQPDSLVKLREQAVRELQAGEALSHNGPIANKSVVPATMPMFTIAGRIRQKRTLGGKLVFYEIHDGESDGKQVSLQIMSSAADWSSSSSSSSDSSSSSSSSSTTISQFRSFHESIRRGDVVFARGYLCRSQHGEPSLCPVSMRLLSPCLHDIPARITDPHLRARQQYVTMRTGNHHQQQHQADQSNNISIIARAVRVRARLYSAIRSFLDQRGFVEVETPVLSQSVGGAAAHPFITHAREASGGRTNVPLYLRIAPELYLKQLVVGGIDRVYELGKQFRNEGLDASHNPEFTTLEFYQAYATVNDLIPMTEAMLRQVVSSALDLSSSSLSSSSTITSTPISSNSSTSTSTCNDNASTPASHYWDRAEPYARISVVSELERHIGTSGISAVFDRNASHLKDIALSCGAILPHERHSEGFSLPKIVDRLVGHYVEPLCLEPTFLVDLPLCLSPLARESTSLPGTAERFEMFSRGVELINAYTELNDPYEQRRRFQEQQQYKDLSGDAETHPPDEHFCHALEYAMPPTAGWGMGLDRLLMQILDTEHIRDVIVAARTA